jgi:hypothetical protein
MKDMLDRDIMVGDTLAYVEHYNSRLDTAVVKETAPFAMLLTLPAYDPQDGQSLCLPERDIVVPQGSAVDYVICDWAKGSDVV